MTSNNNCREGCKTQDHNSWGECARDANLTIGAISGTVKSDTISEWDKSLNLYASARRQGLQPKNTSAAESKKTIQEAGASENG